MKRHTRFLIPAWAGAGYILASLTLIPWTVYLNNTLNTRHVFRHWDIVWVGFDIALAVCLLLTGIAAHKKSPYVIMAATLTGGVLLMDAWFDVLGARPGADLIQSIVAAVLLEIPLAFASFRLAYLAMRNLSPDKSPGR